MEERVTRLKNLRRGKKASLTKRLAKLKQMVADGKASRTKLRFLMTAAYECLHAVTLDCNELFSMVTDPDSEWLEDLKTEVDECAAEVSEHLSLRQEDDSSSGASLTDSWVRAHAPNFSEIRTDEGTGVDSKRVTFLEENVASTSVADILPSQNLQLPDTSTNTTSYSLFGASEPQTTPSTAVLPDWSSKDATYWRDYFSGSNTRSAQQPSETCPDMSWLNPSKSFDMTPGGFPNLRCTSSVLASSTDYSYSSFTGPRDAYMRPHLTFPPASLPQRTNNQFMNKRGIPSSQGSSPTLPNEVDTWIDRLDENVDTSPRPSPSTEADLSLWFVQQTLPQPKIVPFDGSPLRWVPFITKFHNLVHKQAFIPVSVKLIYLHDFVEGEPMSAIRGFPDTWSGYVLSLKTLKFLFGQRTNIAQATLGKVIRCKPIQDDDEAGLSEFYYAVNECLVTLKLLNYASDINSSDTLRQTAGKLPINLQRKWAERCWKIRKTDEPNMIHFQSWLRDCVQARREACWPNQQRKKTPSAVSGRDMTRISAGTFSEKPGDCPLCKGSHYLGRCEKYTLLPDAEKLQTVLRLQVCCNCVKPGHVTAECPSKAVCREKDCEGKHHTSIHKVHKELEKQLKKKPTDNTALVSLLKSPKEVFLLVVPVVIHPPNGEPVHTYALLDNCSQSTLL